MNVAAPPLFTKAQTSKASPSILWKRTFALALLTSLAHCGSIHDIACGEGTMLVDDTCVPLAMDGGQTTQDPDSGARLESDAGSSITEDATAHDAVFGADAGPGAPCSTTEPRTTSTPDQIECEDRVCTGSDLCVFTLDGPECKPEERVYEVDYVRECDEAADCSSGAVCCLSYVSGSTYFYIATCEASCPYGSGQQACATDEECGSGATCQRYFTHNPLIMSLCGPPIGC